MAVQYAPTKLRVPPGFQNLLEGLAREVLREQPEDIIQFGAQYFKNQLAIREETGKDDAKRGEKLEKLMKGEVDIDIDDPEVQAAATKIQASFRGHKTREDMKQRKGEEDAALKIQSSFRGHKAREEVKELIESRSRESMDVSPAKEAATEEKPGSTEAEKAADEVDIDLTDPDVQGAALKIQASFRGHKAREEVKNIQSSESVSKAKEEGKGEEESVEAAAGEPIETSSKEVIDVDLNDPEVQNAAQVIQANFRSHKSRESVKSLKDEESKQEDSPADAAATADATHVDIPDVPAQNAEEEIDIDLDDPEVSKAATKIQATFRGHKTRKDMKDGSSPEDGSNASLKTEEAEAAPESGEAATPEAGEEQQEATPTVNAPEQEQEAPPGEEGKEQETTPAGDGQEESAAPVGDGQEESAAPEGDGQEESAAPEGDGQEESAAPEGDGQEESAAPEGDGQEESAAPEGDGQEESAAPGGNEQEESAAPEGDGQEASAIPEGDTPVTGSVQGEQGEEQEESPAGEAQAEGEGKQEES